MSIKQDMTAWNISIGQVIAQIDNPKVLRALMDGIANNIFFDMWYVAFMRKDAPPIEVEYSYASETRESYAEGPYLLDPFYTAYLDGIEPGCYTMQELAPADFKSSEFYLSYYSPWGDTNEVAYILHIDDKTAAHISLSRKMKGARFGTAEMRFLNQISPIIQAVMERIWNRIKPEVQQNDRFSIDFHIRLTQAFRMFATSVLTERECEIAHLLLRGHSAKSIARLLNISPGTVRNHMKSIYAKLEISSQSELFGLFFETLSHAGSDMEADPLTYLYASDRIN